MAVAHARSFDHSGEVDLNRAVNLFPFVGVIAGALLEGAIGHWAAMDVLMVASMGLAAWRIGSRPVWFGAVTVAVVAVAWVAPGQSFGAAVMLLGALIALALNQSATMRADELSSAGIDPVPNVRRSI